MFEEIVLDTRISNLLSYGFRSRVIGTLGAMVNVDSEVFYTSSDIAYCILGKVGISLESLRPYDIREFISVISSILSDSYRKGLSDVYRTNRRIHPKYFNGRASYGYRIGLAYGRRTITPDTLSEHKLVASSSPKAELSVSALEIGERAASLMEYHELCQMELTIQRRKEELFSSLQKQLSGDKS